MSDSAKNDDNLRTSTMLEMLGLISGSSLKKAIRHCIENNGMSVEVYMFMQGCASKGAELDAAVAVVLHEG